MLTVLISLFAFATILGWGLYGVRCAQFLFGDGVWKRFVYLQGIFVVLGSVLTTETAWILAEIVNGLMAIPNLIAIALLSPHLVILINDYKKFLGQEKNKESIIG